MLRLSRTHTNLKPVEPPVLTSEQPKPRRGRPPKRQLTPPAPIAHEPVAIKHQDGPKLRLVGTLPDFPDPPALRLLRSIMADKAPVVRIQLDPGENYLAATRQLRWAAQRLGVRLTFRPDQDDPKGSFLLRWRKS